MFTISRDSGYADHLRKYRVELDGTSIGTIADGETQTGAHTLRIKIDWGGSNKIKFQDRADKNHSFKCSSKARGVKVLLVILYATILSQKYIKLELVD